MPNGIASRLGQLCVALHLTLPDLARLTNHPADYITRVIDGQARVTPRLQAHVLEQFPAVNPHWLLAGEGPMFRVVPHVASPADGNAGNLVAANYGVNIQLLSPEPCRCCCTINLLQDHLREKERVIQLLLQQLPTTTPLIDLL